MVRVQQSDYPIRIGVLTASWGPKPQVVGLRDGLIELGYREHEQFVLGVRFTQGNLKTRSFTLRFKSPTYCGCSSMYAAIRSSRIFTPIARCLIVSTASNQNDRSCVVRVFGGIGESKHCSPRFANERRKLVGTAYWITLDA